MKANIQNAAAIISRMLLPILESDCSFETALDDIVATPSSSHFVDFDR
jgi:hypothetical protein